MYTIGMELDAKALFYGRFNHFVDVPTLGRSGRIWMSFDIRTNEVTFQVSAGDSSGRLRRGFVFTMCRPDGTPVLSEPSVHSKVTLSGERIRLAFEQGATSVAFRAINKVVAIGALPAATIASAQSS